MKRQKSEIVIGFYAILGALLGLSFIVFIYKYCHTTRKISVKYVIYTVLCSVFYMITIVNNIIYDLQSEFTMIALLSDGLQILGWHMGNIVLYVYLLSRLNEGFRGTIYALKKVIHRTLLVLILIYLGFVIYLLILNIIRIDSGQSSISDKVFIRNVLITKIGTLGADIFLSTSLLIIFIHKLYTVGKYKQIQKHDLKRPLMMSYTQNIETIELTSKTQSISPTHSPRFTHKKELKQDRIFSTIGKVTLLSIIMLISNQSVMIMSVVSWQYIDAERYPILNQHVNGGYGIVKVSDAFLTSFCLILGFKFMENWYKICCGCCNDIIQEYYIGKMENEMHKQIQYNHPTSIN